MHGLTSADATDALQAAREILHRTYGYAAFRSHQEAAISAVLQGGDCLVLMPTGGGKSLCYQIPALIRPGAGIVVSPLIALMDDQVHALRELGIRADVLNSTLDAPAQAAVVDRLRQGAIDLLYVAPERLLQQRTLELLASVPLALFAIDEAHCVSEWGHDFREEYLQLDVLRDRFPAVPRIALTATADQRTRVEIAARLALADPTLLVAGFDRPNIRYHVAAKGTSPRTQLASFLEGRRDQAGIVYCMSRRKVEETATWLRTRGYDALPYHAGLSIEARKTHQARFLREDGVVMVATIAFGMGIDKPDVRFVAHLDLPKSMEAYYQETGRAGRDGEPATAWMIYGLQDVVRLQQMVEQSAAGEHRRRIEREKLDALLAWCETTGCRRTALLDYFGDTYQGPCNNCDVCIDPPSTRDATDPARKLLSCIYRTGQRFGLMHVLDVLMGNDTEKVRQHGHHALSTFGIGSELTIPQWRAVVRQLLVRGYLQADHARFGALVLTEKSRGLLRGSETFRVREDTREPRSKVRPRKGATRADATLAPESQALWEVLRELRRSLADSHNVPPYVIFHDRTLREIACRRPTSAAELLEITGVGQAKLARYGSAFLDALAAHKALAASK
jgi:ATP-dependent DNA helicase RecQ